MKQVLTKFLVLGGVGLLMLSACKKDGALVTSNGGKPGALTASTNTLMLDKSKLNDTTKVINFTFTPPSYGFNAAVTNTLQIDPVGDNWAKPTSVTLGTKVYSQGYSTNDFNGLLLKLNLVGGVTSQVNVRVEHSVSTSVAPIYSNVLSLTVTPYNLASSIYIVGGYQGWSTGTADSLVSLTSNGIYTGVIPFTAGSGNNNFKVLLNKLNYTGSYGWASTASSTSVTYGTNTLTVTNENITQASSGGNLFSLTAPSDDAAVSITSNYVVLDVNKNTISLTPTLWSVVGDGSPGGWPNSTGPQSDTDMKFDEANQVWSVTTPLTVGNIKFRLNHDWGYNLGGTNPLTNNGANIAITTAGTYKITLNAITSTYTLTKQ